MQDIKEDDYQNKTGSVNTETETKQDTEEGIPRNSRN